MFNEKINKIDKLGIVLDGGGGMGSYQIGVWKYYGFRNAVLYRKY